MTVGEAWIELGGNPIEVFRRISAAPSLDAKLKVAEDTLEEAKKLAKAAWAKNHPDRGGSQAKFVQIQKALECVEEATASFRSLVDQKKAEAEARANRKGTFIVLK